MKKEKIFVILLYVIGIITIIAGSVTSFMLGNLYRNSVSNFFYTQNFYNWQIAVAGVLVSFALGFLLLGAAVIIKHMVRIEDAKNNLEMSEDTEKKQSDELPRI